ncbi:glycerate kinase [Mitsuokella sp. AF21-1AC]|uniref:glycerate kinase family protein n=1 Tax=Mitsuokella sp. AF21-1AC TaxID=2292235 RepID=UPI000E47C2DA|nr:glycerate kinase [Mitsuokella sp. AF21-1AC]RGS70090.1 glycerate kinase [Mitsuokella sp. AF21-1AC]
MNIVISIDSFKGCMSSMDSGKVLQQAIHDVYPEDHVQVFPLADGGEGTVDAMTQGLHGRIVEVPVTGPLGTRITSRYGFLPDTKTAIIEMADASGLTLVPPEKRNPLHTTTFGLGELILAAMDHGCRHFIIGIGGSATNDCGLGMLTALGFRFQKADGSPAGIMGGDLAEVASLDMAQSDARLKDCTFEIACDVTNPLCGEEGCSRVFGPQKGATEAIIRRMDGDIHRFAELAEKQSGIEGQKLPGAGAAGGLGFAFHVFLHGALTPGVDLILSAIGIDKALAEADLLVTGEGRMDQQTAMGKAPAGVAQLAKACQPRCLTVALCGCATREAERVNQHGIDAYFPILHAPMTLEEAMSRTTTEQNLRQTMQQVMHLIHAGKRA